MRKLTEFSVNYPVTILMVVLAVFLLGYISYDKLGVDLFPELNNPKLFVEITSGERPPEEMEKQFVENIEALAIRQSDVVQVSSVSKVGTAQITVEYAWEKDMDEAFLDLQKAVSAYAQNKDIDKVNITQHDPNTSPVLVVGMSHETNTDMNELRKVAENYIRNELIRLEGVAEVEITGSEESEVLIQTEPYLLDAFGLTMDEIQNRVQSFNQNISGGSINEMGLRYVVKGVSLLENVEDFENIIVGYKSVAAEDQTATKAPIFLREVAKVTIHNKEPENIVHLDGKRCLGLSIYKETKFNTVKAVEQISEEFKNIEKALPGYKFTIVSNQGTFIRNSVDEVKDNLLVGILLSVVVLFVFLRRIGSTLIVSIAMPISIVATFNLMYFNGLSLNIMTLGGLALGAGMLVDNAIVVMENIFRNLENGLSVKEAAITGTSEVGGAIVASTLTTIVVFLPIVYLHGASGELFKDQAWTVTFSLLSSLAAAIMVIPMLFNFFFKNNKKVYTYRSVQIKGYGRFLGRLLKARGVVITIAFAVMISAFMLVPYIGTEFMPKTETKEFTINLKMQEGTQLERTAATVSNVENIIRDQLGDQLENLYSEVGPTTGTATSASSIFEGENTAKIKVILKKDGALRSSQAIQAIGGSIQGINGMEASFVQDETALKSILGTDNAPLEVEIQGKELDEIESISKQVKERLVALPELYNLQTSMEDGSPEVEVVVDRLRAGLFNLSVANVVTQIQNQLEGKNLGQVEKSGEMQDITLKLPEHALSDLNGMVIKTGSQLIRVDEVATIRIGQSPKEILHRNQNRIAKISADMSNSVALDKIVKKVKAQIADIPLLPEYKITVTGEEEKRQEAMNNLGLALLLSLALVYMVLASQFESLLHPFTIMLTIPMAVVGSIVAFFVLGRNMNIMALIGIIMLAGIAVNNAIILMDRIIQLQKKGGLSRSEAIIQAGQQRIRPIMMTTLTTVLALVPLTLGIGESASLRSPMALAVIGGMVTSTILSLVVIPCVYDVVEGMKDRLFKAEK